MNIVIQFVTITAAVLGSIALALLIEWLSLWGLMQLMPARQAQRTPIERIADDRNLYRLRQSIR